LQLLGAPQLKKVELWEAYVSKYEVDELLALARERRILHNKVDFLWYNSYEETKLEPWMAEKKHFDLLLDSLWKQHFLKSNLSVNKCKTITRFSFF
jgi:hypothetical protein